MRAPAGARSLTRVLFERKVASDRGHLRGHDISRTEPLQSALRGDLRVALPGRSEQEPSQKYEPDAIYAGVRHERPVRPKSHHAVGDGLPYTCRNARGSRIILGNSPDYGAEDTAAIEWKTRQ